MKGIMEFFTNSAESSSFFLDKKLISIIVNHIVFILFIVKIFEETVSWNEMKKQKNKWKMKFLISFFQQS